MATLRLLFRTASACLTMCQFVVCGGEGRVFTRHRTGAYSAWVTLPPSHSSFGGPSFNHTPRWGAAPRPSATLSATSEGAPSSTSRKRQNATALFCMLRDELHGSSSSPPSSWLRSGRGRGRGRVVECVRGRGAGGFRLGAVTAVRSPGEAGGAGMAVGGDEELREAFNAAAGEGGLLGLGGFRALEDVRELLEDGLLQEAEVLAIWKAVPKADATGDRVDFVGFREAFARVDSLFEEEEEEEEEEIPAESAEAGVGVGGGQGARGEAVAGGAGETEASFFELVGSTEGVLDLNGLLRWSEVTELIEEGLLSQEEVEQIWKGLPKVANRVKAAGAAGTEKGMLINLDGFLEFDRQLSDLFEDEESADQPPAVATNGQPPRAEAPAEATKAAVAEEEVVVDDKTPEGQFLKLSGGTGGVLTLDGLLGWTEVSELLDDDLITREEVATMFQTLPKAKGRGSSSSAPAIDTKGFVEFARKLEEMFEVVEEDDSISAEAAASRSNTSGTGTGPSPAPAASTQLPDMKTAVEAGGAVGGNAAEAKARLLSMSQAEMADCGMGCGENKRTQMLEAMEGLLATKEGNFVLGDDLGAGLVDKLVGEWRLLYTSSNAMEYNQGLTGLANTIPNAKFQGLRQILHADGMVFDAEYEEELNTGDASEPLIITVTSDWEVKQTSSLVTGKSTVAVAVAPKQIKYGFITVRSERWKTLRAMMLLDIAYLDADLRIMRGQTARQNFFVFQRV